MHAIWTVSTPATSCHFMALDLASTICYRFIKHMVWPNSQVFVPHLLCVWAVRCMLEGE